MSNTTGKRGFVPAQPAAAISALDFAAASEAFAAARAKDNTAKDEAEAEAIADLIAERADRLIGIPAVNPSQIAEKVNAFLWLHGCTGGDLSDPATQQRIAVSQNEPAKCLLAIYLDLTASAPDRSAWDAAHSAYNAAWAARQVLTEAEEGNGLDTSEEWEAADSALQDALDTLLNTRAPDGVAMGFKARAVIERQHIAYTGDSVTDPAFVSQLLAEGWDEHLAAALYQDGLALAGEASPVAQAQPDTFDAEGCLATVETETGARLVRSDAYGNVRWEGGDTETAVARLADLRPHHRNEVEGRAVQRAKREAYEAAGPAPQRLPSTPEEMQSIFARGLINATPEADKAALETAIVALGITPWPVNEEGQ